MRIGINGWFWGTPEVGSGQYVHHLLHSLLRVAPEHEYILYLPGAQPHAVNVPVPDGVRVQVVRTPFDRYWDNLAKVWYEQIALPRAALADAVDVLHVPYWGSALVRRVPTVVTVHDLIPMLLLAYRGGLLVRTYTRLVAEGARRADMVLTDSQASRRDIRRYLKVPPERVRAVPLAVDGMYRRVTDEERLSYVQEKYRLPPRFLLYLGGFDQRKNVTTLLQAFAALVLTVEQAAEEAKETEDVLSVLDVKLVVAGRLPARDTRFFPDPRKIVQAFGIRDHVRFIGWVDEEDKPALYTLAEALVFPSLYEGFGLPVLEAMACGTPVIAANAASLPELVGDAGLLVAPRDVEGLAEAMLQVLTDPSLKEELSRRAMDKALRFTWEEVARATLDAYDWVARRADGT
ncbi:MAG: glycosyltransferase family 4 protein [Chloroflexi bacterium]|nr:glycosyltransferase family 4 protein [Chloroflexota bacterium]